MFLNHLIARAEGTAPVLKSAPKLAQELEDPTWSPAPDMDPAEFGAAEPLPTASPRPRHGGSPRQPGAVEPKPKAMSGPAKPPLPAASAATPESLQAPASKQPTTAQSTTPVLEVPAHRPLAALPPQVEPRADTAPRPAPTAEAPAAVTPPQPPLSSPPPAPQISPEIIAALAPPPPAAAQPERHDVQPSPVAADNESTERIEVHVEIGQLDLVSPPPPTRPTANPASRTARPGPDLSLTDYLERGRGNRR